MTTLLTEQDAAALLKVTGKNLARMALSRWWAALRKSRGALC